MVPDIKDIRAEQKLVAFFNVESLLNRKVPVLLEWTTERIACHAAIARCSRGPVCDQGGRAHVIWIQVVSQPTLDGTRRQHLVQ